eukprot:2945678-Karenia_brevis.AAC.1
MEAEVKTEDGHRTWMEGVEEQEAKTNAEDEAEERAGKKSKCVRIPSRSLTPICLGFQRISLRSRRTLVCCGRCQSSRLIARSTKKSTSRA